MMEGFSMLREPGSGGGGSSMTIGGADARYVRDVLQRHAQATLTASELRAGLRPFVRRARDGGATIEQLLVALKRIWAELPEARLADGARSETTRRMERAVTLLIETYYEV